MKSTAFALLFLGSFLFACDHDKDDDVKPDDVPAAVKEALSTAFPEATAVEWEKKGEEYEADFNVATVDYDARFNAAGNLLMHKFDISEAELPAEVKAALTQNYADYRVDEAEELVKNGGTYYQVDLEKGNQEQKLVFAADGQEQTGAPYWD